MWLLFEKKNFHGITSLRARTNLRYVWRDGISNGNHALFFQIVLTFVAEFLHFSRSTCLFNDTFQVSDMARSRSSSRSSSRPTSAPSRPVPTPQQQQQRQASTQAAPSTATNNVPAPVNTATPPPQTYASAPQQPGLFAQMASTYVFVSH
jgi:hypothetical protein